MYNRILMHVDKVERLLDGLHINPINCEIDLSNNCDRNCSYCLYKDFRSNEPVDLDYSLYLNLLLNLMDCNVKSITFTGGGEPLNHPRAEEMIKRALDSGFECGLITGKSNLSNLTLNTLNRLTFIRISLQHSIASTQIPEIEHCLKQLDKPVIGCSVVIDNEQDAKDILNKSNLNTIKYIQFKIDCTLDSPLIVFNNTDKTIISNRYKSLDDAPCKIAGLIGIVSANGKVYYCCQSRGMKSRELGDLRKDSFQSIWKRRTNLNIDVSECCACRYNDYLLEYNSLTELDKIFLKQKTFL